MKIKITLSIGLIIIMLLANTSFSSSGAQEQEKNLSISTFPSEVFIDLSGLKPGDNIIKSIDVKNIGNLDFSYSTYSEFKDGSKKYFNALELSVYDNKENMIFDGFLRDLKSISKRELAIFTQEKLRFEVHIPHHLGNEYQGLSTEFNLVFNAEEVIGDKNIVPSVPVSNDTNQLPNTAKNYYNFILLGILLLVIGSLGAILRKRYAKQEY
ncbi:LPXTG cell wall anchor domain-containing protein [Sutcliffiella horikoshii]|uniref:LPXTG cell wall anchor domain-containing protein n=1 Tax=Sutcliffiella horikoshii TaxID=79883 RepID=UPI001CFD33A1|nr:LPXTG cell wall anchor domain-containing protein [Sutcliffiella horikoshii]